MSGIGSSSSFTVGLLLALHGLMGNLATKRELAEQAIEVEQEWIKEAVGSQDQYAAAFGGLNRIDFPRDRGIQISPLTIDKGMLNYLQDNLVFCFSGISRISSEIQADHVKSLPAISAELGETRALVDEAYKLLHGGEEDIDAFGRLLDQAWKIKRRFTSRVSNSSLDALYESARRAGALGGKVCGAGGGGFLIFYAPRDRRQAVEEALSPSLLVPIRFEHIGAHVVFFSHADLPEKRSGGQGELS
jgi:D-glycero-alpha-D-manno-heptose-7-phosphate kinase